MVANQLRDSNETKTRINKNGWRDFEKWLLFRCQFFIRFLINRLFFSRFSFNATFVCVGHCWSMILFHWCSRFCAQFYFLRFLNEWLFFTNHSFKLITWNQVGQYFCFIFGKFLGICVFLPGVDSSSLIQFRHHQSLFSIT